MGGGRRLALLTLAASLAAMMSRAAVAQPKVPGGEVETGSATATAKDPKAAKKWLAAAQQLAQKGSYLAAKNRPEEAKAQLENAITAYQKALDAGDDPNVYLELASVEDKLGKLDDAVKHLRRVVAAKTGVRPEVLKKATGKLDELSAKVGLVTLTILPAGSSITLGGVELGTSPLPEPLVLMPGTYTLSFQAEGFQPREAEIKIEAGSEAERTIALEPVKVIVEPVKPPVIEPAPQPVARPREPSRRPLYIGAGVTGAGVLGVGLFGILAISQHATFTGSSTSRLDRANARTSGQRFALIADLSLGTAVVAAGFTAYWYFYKYKRFPKKSEERHAPQVETKLDVVPWVQSQSGGVTLAGWF